MAHPTPSRSARGLAAAGPVDDRWPSERMALARVDHRRRSRRGARARVSNAAVAAAAARGAWRWRATHSAPGPVAPPPEAVVLLAEMGGSAHWSGIPSQA